MSPLEQPSEEVGVLFYLTRGKKNDYRCPGTSLRRRFSAARTRMRRHFEFGVARCSCALECTRAHWGTWLTFVECRTPLRRTPGVTFVIGQSLMHSTLGPCIPYGWDPVCRAVEPPSAAAMERDFETMVHLRRSQERARAGGGAG